MPTNASPRMVFQTECHALYPYFPKWVKCGSNRGKRRPAPTKRATNLTVYRSFSSRSDGIRTHGLLVPNQARYQLRYTPIKKPQQQSCCGVVGDERIELPRAESESAALPLCESPSHFVVGVCPQRLTIIAGVALFVNSFFYFFYLFFKCRFSVIFRFHRVDKPGPVS